MSAATTLVPEAHAQTATGADTESLVSYRFNEYDEDAFARHVRSSAARNATA